MRSFLTLSIVVAATLVAPGQDDSPRASRNGGLDLSTEVPSEGRVYAPFDATSLAVATPLGRKVLAYDCSLGELPHRATWSGAVEWQNPDRGGRTESLDVRFDLEARGATSIVVDAHAGAAARAEHVVEFNVAFRARVAGSDSWIALDDVRQLPENGGRTFSEYAFGFREQAPIETDVPDVIVPSFDVVFEDGVARCMVQGGAPHGSGSLFVAVLDPKADSCFTTDSILASAFVTTSVIAFDGNGSWMIACPLEGVVGGRTLEDVAGVEISTFVIDLDVGVRLMTGFVAPASR